MTVSIRPIEAHEFEAVRLLLRANGWSGARLESENFAALVANARDAIVAVDGDRVVGFARALGDGIFNGYLSMLVVDAGYRKQGIGRALVERVMGDNPDMTWVLRARGDVQKFYEKIGFVQSTVAMERVRVEPPLGKTT
jgi:ribosomal protein S18 acetylase RimI-like enzyme